MKLIDFFIFKRSNEEARKIFRESAAFETGGVKNMLLEVVDQMENCLEESSQEMLEEECKIEENQDSAIEEVKEEFLEQAESPSHLDVEDEEKDEARDETELQESEEEEMEVYNNYDEDEPPEILDDVDCEQNETISKPNLAKRKSNREKNPKTWLRYRRKLAKNTGKSYYASNGKFVEAKEMKCSCGQSCRMQCSKKISEENRLQNFNFFYSLGDIAKQRKFLFDHMKSYEPKRTKTPKNPQKLRAVQRCYFLDLTNEHGTSELQVCKLMFLNTFAISSQMIDTLFRKATNEDGFSDIRGKFERKR